MGKEWLILREERKEKQLLERPYLAPHVKNRSRAGCSVSPSSAEGGWGLCDDPEASPRRRTLSPEMQGGVRTPRTFPTRNRWVLIQEQTACFLPLWREHWTERAQRLPSSPLPLAGQGCPTQSLPFFPWAEAGSAKKSRGFAVHSWAWV